MANSNLNPVPTPPFRLTSVDRYRALLEFISEHWSDTVRHQTEDYDNHIGLPFPYTVPCRRDGFQDLYYWDTFYANEGLLAQGRLDLAKHNVDNMLHLVKRFGFMPNGNRTFFLTRSQPPHLALMVERIFANTGDTQWLEEALVGLEIEQKFWQTNRLTPCGLNHYGHQASDSELIDSWQISDPRQGIDRPVPSNDADKIRLAGHSYAECESGWDFCPRFDNRCSDFCPVDLNTLLYASEHIIAKAHRQLGHHRDAEDWNIRIEMRTGLMRQFLWSSSMGSFTDYDYVKNRQSSLVSAAIFYPVWLGLTNRRETEFTLNLLPRLERPHGILACEPGPRTRACQWDAPNAWPPLQYAAFRALVTGGRLNDAQRVASSFLDTVVRGLTETGDLWEKYNAETGDLQVQNEYKLPAMMGWTAGVCAALCA